jgi:hypothetical protein
MENGNVVIPQVVRSVITSGAAEYDGGRQGGANNAQRESGLQLAPKTASRGT